MDKYEQFKAELVELCKKHGVTFMLNCHSVENELVPKDYLYWLECLNDIQGMKPHL